MISLPRFHHLWHSLSHITAHAATTLLAVGLAFAMPQAAQFILFQWWPKVQKDSSLLLLTEIVFAAALVLLFNLARLAWHFRRRARLADLAALVHAREFDGPGPVSRGEVGSSGGSGGMGSMLQQVPWQRDLTIMAVTGYGTFGAPDAVLSPVLKDCYELRVMLLDPGSPAAQAYVSGHPDPAAALAELRRETAASVACLGQLQSAGKQVVLKFYDGPPFWKLVFTGEYVWVRSSHSGLDSRQNPEYVFALRPDKPNRGFFPAFYTYFLSLWNDPSHPSYSFESDELVYRDAAGQELERRPWHPAESGLEAQPIPAA